MKERENSKPNVIEQINENFRKLAPEEPVTVEWLAQQVGVDRKSLYRWAQSNEGFSDMLESFYALQRHPPFEPDLEIDNPVQEMLLTILIMEARDEIAKQN